MTSNQVDSPNPQEIIFISKAARGFLLTTAFAGFAALALLLNTPSESTISYILGISGLRLILATGFLVFSLLSILIYIHSRRSPASFIQRLNLFCQKIESPAIWTLFLLISLFLFLTCLFLITLTPEVQEPFTRVYFERALPVIMWLNIISLAAVLFLLVVRFGSRPFRWLPKGKSFYIPLLTFGIFYAGWIFIARPRLPMETRITGWNIASAPILDTQIVLAWVAGALLAIGWFILLRKYPQISKKRLNFVQRIDAFIFIAFWLFSAIIWQSVPIQPSWFVSEPVPPNQEFYPTSDARVYDISAQTALVGSGFKFFDSPFIRRPLHAAYLTILHLIAGQNYDTIVFLQIIVLALLPPFIYLLAKSLHDRPAGVIAAMLVMLREANAISISGRITTSNAKELLVDLPTTLGMVIFTLIIIHWLKRFNLRKEFALIAGGVLGLVLLIRLEMSLAILVTAGVALVISRSPKIPWNWLKAMLLFVMGIALVLLPWIYRNWSLTGQIFLDSPLWRTDLLQQRFQPTPEPTSTIIAKAPEISEAITSLPPIPPTAETPVQATPLPLDDQPIPTLASTSLSSETYRVLSFFLDSPGQVAGFIATHYLNSQMQSFLILPTTVRQFDSFTAFLGHHSLERLWDQCCSAIEYIRRMPYWHKWDGSIPSQAILPLIINILLITLGIHLSWRNHHLIGMIPGLIAAAHFLLNATFRNSGGRYILPVDWVGIVYFSIGLSYITTRTLKNFFDPSGSEAWQRDLDSRSTGDIGYTPTSKTPLLYAIAGIFLIIGLMIPVTEILIKPSYTEARQEQLLNAFLNSPKLATGQREFLIAFIAQGGEYLVGRGLYPEFLPGNSGEVAKYKFNPAPFPRLSFYLAGPDSKTILMPVARRIKYFPNGVDVIVIGCPITNTPQGTRQIDVLAVGIFSTSGNLEAMITRFPDATEPRCPLPSPYSQNPASQP